MNVLNFIAQDGFIMLNKSIIKKIGLHESIILGAFASKQNYNDGWFYFTYEEIEEITTLSKHQASKAIDNLINFDILIDKREGVPCRRYFMLQVEELINCLSLKNLTTGGKEIKPLVVKKLNDIIVSNNTVNKNTKDNTLNILTEVINHFNLKTNKTKYQKGSERATLEKYINAMIKNGDTLESIKNLIDYKLANPNTQKIDLLSWLNTQYVGQNMANANQWLSDNKPNVAKFTNGKPESKLHRANSQNFTDEVF